jgi:hypothetical protein
LQDRGHNASLVKYRYCVYGGQALRLFDPIELEILSKMLLRNMACNWLFKGEKPQALPTNASLAKLPHRVHNLYTSLTIYVILEGPLR